MIFTSKTTWWRRPHLKAFKTDYITHFFVFASLPIYCLTRITVVVVVVAVVTAVVEFLVNRESHNKPYSIGLYRFCLCIKVEGLNKSGKSE